MFNRAMKCLSFVQKTLMFKIMKKKCKPSFIYTINLEYGNCNSILVEKRFCSTAPKSPETDEKEIPYKQEIHTNIAEKELQAMLDSDPAMNKRYKVLQLEVDVLRQAGKLVPNEIKPLHWIELLKERTRSSRRNFLTFLFKMEKKHENAKKRKEVAKIKFEKDRESRVEDDNEYKLHRSTMFLRIYESKINHFYHSRLIQAMMFGEKLIIDCGYDTHMTTREQGDCAKQLSYLFAQNRMHSNPFDLHFCNVNKSSLLMQKFKNIVPTAYNSDFPLNINECSYTELFDTSKLVYLTPHCQNEMMEYDFNSTYIVGAIVDKTNSAPLSLAKAKKQGLRMAKLPLDRYLSWGSGGSKRLPLNHIINILLEMKVTQDWNEAFKYIPRRKLEYQDQSKPRSYAMSETKFQHNIYPSKEAKSQTQNNFNFKERQKKRFSE